MPTDKCQEKKMGSIPARRHPLYRRRISHSMSGIRTGSRGCLYVLRRCWRYTAYSLCHRQDVSFSLSAKLSQEELFRLFGFRMHLINVYRGQRNDMPRGLLRPEPIRRNAPLLHIIVASLFWQGMGCLRFCLAGTAVSTACPVASLCSRFFPDTLVSTGSSAWIARGDPSDGL